MIPAAQALITELQAETPATRCVLERVPGDHLDWRPHRKSMSLAQLAHHVASVPGGIARIAALDELDGATVDFEPEPAASAEALLPTLEESIAAACAFLAGLTEESATAPWRLTWDGREVFTLPRIALMRTLALNHWYHHRGQLLVYLRLLDLPVPAVYGRSADEDLLSLPRA